MSNKYEFDKTRNAIGADSISDAERAEMLRKFRESGGQVLKERSLEQKESPSNRKTSVTNSDNLTNLPSKREQRDFRDRDRIQSNKDSKKKNNERKNRKPRTGFLYVLLFRMRAFLSGTTNLTGDKIKNTFAKFILEKLQPSLLLLHSNLTFFFMSNQGEIKKIIKKLDEENPIFIEILNHLNSLYNVTDFTIIDETLKNSVNKNVDIYEIIQPIKSLYLKLYYLSPWMLTASKILNRFSQLYIQDLPTEQDVCQLKIKEIKKILNNILDIAFKNYFLIICCEAKAVFDSASKAFQNHIGFQSEGVLGKRVSGENCELVGFNNKLNDPQIDDSVEVDNESTLETQDVEEEPEEGHPIAKTKEYEYGKLLISKLEPQKCRVKHDSNGYYSDLEDLDKVFLCMMFFKEFDFEYSPILTTKQIHYNVDFSYGVKKDYSKILPEISTSTRSIDQAFEEYCTLSREIKKIREDSMMSYIERSKRETTLQLKINTQTGTFRTVLTAYLYKVVSNLATLIAGIKEGKKIIENIEDVLSLGGKLDAKKKLSGKKVKEAITEAYCYSLTLKYQIEEGKLRGVGLLNDVEAKILLKDYAAPPSVDESSSSKTELEIKDTTEFIGSKLKTDSSIISTPKI